ncbi:predicted protein [Nematostella vectensis]|uniref:Uncharacterized protein n=1 Tax=Nematostella vectensis TaxID=45351 RepID=A7SMD1_NEMVE|nr:predicted protein [Nematostella vectensis]|eukprot:XP_001627247.1 predicted protein [Nematostella vectensis]
MPNHYLMLSTFSFIVAIVIVRHILALTKPLTVKLQSKAMDILKAKEELALLISVLIEMSNDIDATHHELYQDAVTIARQVDVQPDMPRVAQRQRHRPNAPAANPEDYYKINLTRVFLDHVFEQLDSRFKDDVFICYKVNPCERLGLCITTGGKAKGVHNRCCGAKRTARYARQGNLDNAFAKLDGFYSSVSSQAYPMNES